MAANPNIGKLSDEILGIWLERAMAKLVKEMGPEEATSILEDLQNALPKKVQGELLTSGQALIMALALGHWAKFQMDGGLNFLDN